MQKQSPQDYSEKMSPVSLVPDVFAAFNKKRMEEFVDMQSEWFGKMQEASQQWIDRMQSEAKVDAEFAAKLTAAKSLPDAMTICQEWNGRRLEMMADDGKRFFADLQKLMETNARLLSNGWLSNGAHIST